MFERCGMGPQKYAVLGIRWPCGKTVGPFTITWAQWANFGPSNLRKILVGMELHDTGMISTARTNMEYHKMQALGTARYVKRKGE